MKEIKFCDTETIKERVSSTACWDGGQERGGRGRGWPRSSEGRAAEGGAAEGGGLRAFSQYSTGASHSSYHSGIDGQNINNVPPSSNTGPTQNCTFALISWKLSEEPGAAEVAIFILSYHLILTDAYLGCEYCNPEQ